MRKIWPSIRKKPPIIQRTFRGENKLDSFAISPEYAMDTKNLTAAKFPALSVRPDFSVLGDAVGTKVLGLAAWKDSEIHAVFNDGTWRKWSGSAWTTLESGFSTTAEWSFTHFKGNLGDFYLIGANGVDPVKKYSGSTVSNLSNAPDEANYIDQHDNRLYAVVNETEIHFSELSVATNWENIDGNDSDPGTIVKEVSNGKPIVSLKAGTGHVTIFFPTACYELYGTSASDYQLVEVAPDIGIVNNKAGVVLDGILYFISVRGLYTYGGGSRPDKDFSAPVQWYIDGMNKAALGACFAGTDGKRVYFGIPTGSNTVADVILEFDPLNGTWFVWTDLQAVTAALIDGSFYIGDANGRVLKMTAASSSSIAWRWVSPPITGASMAQVIRFIRAWVTANVPAGSSMNVYLTSEPTADTGWQLAATISADGVLESTPIYLDTTVTPPNARCIRFKFEGTGPMELYEFAWEQDTLPLR